MCWASIHSLRRFGSQMLRLGLFGNVGMQNRSNFLVVCMLAVIFAAGTAAQQTQYGKNGPALLPDMKATPGEAAITNTNEVCKTKWGKDERHVTAKMKRDVYEEYGT